MDWVYMLECGDGSLYTGWTNDLARRLAAHQSGRGAKYTRGRAPVRLVYAEQCTDKSAALRREAAVKALPRARKLELARQWETEEKAMAVAMDSQEARRRMEEGRLYLPGDEAIMAEQTDCLEKQYNYNATRPHEQERRAALLREMFAQIGENCYIEPPLHANWGGRHVHFGSGVYANFNLTLVDDYHTNYSDGSGQQFITLVSKSGNTFYLVIDRNAKGQQTVHFMNLVDEADLLALMEEEDADAYTAEKEAATQAEQDRLKAEEEAKKAAEEAASGTEQPKENKVTKIASGFLGVVVLIALAAGGIFYAFTKQKQKKQAEKEALDPDANYTEDKGDFEIPVEDEPEETGEEDNAEE